MAEANQVREGLGILEDLGYVSIYYIDGWLCASIGCPLEAADAQRMEAVGWKFDEDHEDWQIRL